MKPTRIAGAATFGVLSLLAACANPPDAWLDPIGDDELNLLIAKGLDAVDDGEEEELDSRDSAGVRDTNDGADADGDGYDVRDTNDGADEDGDGYDDTVDYGTTVDCDDNDLSTYPSRKQAFCVLRKLAESQECAPQGVITGEYQDGMFHLMGHWWTTEVAGKAVGRYRPAETRPGGRFAGVYRDISGGDGELEGVFLDPGLAHERFCLFRGEWTPEAFEESAGDLVGIWHPVSHRDGGLVVGIWTSCLEEPVHEEEPADLSEGDERD